MGKYKNIISTPANEKSNQSGVCHKCLKPFELKVGFKIKNYEIWECPYCGYPNSRSDYQAN